MVLAIFIFTAETIFKEFSRIHNKTKKKQDANKLTFRAPPCLFVLTSSLIISQCMRLSDFK